jgi:ubiquinone/menaquinone biosynthesis C-methylase UbiE
MLSSIESERTVQALRDHVKHGSDGECGSVAALLHPPSTLCLDLCCGTGQYFDALRATGRTVVGLDRSTDQLTVARRRTDLLVQGDALHLPFRSDAFDTVTALWI